MIASFNYHQMMSLNLCGGFIYFTCDLQLDLYATMFESLEMSWMYQLTKSFIRFFICLLLSALQLMYWHIRIQNNFVCFTLNCASVLFHYLFSFFRYRHLAQSQCPLYSRCYNLKEKVRRAEKEQETATRTIGRCKSAWLSVIWDDFVTNNLIVLSVSVYSLQNA